MNKTPEEYEDEIWELKRQIEDWEESARVLMVTMAGLVTYYETHNWWKVGLIVIICWIVGGMLAKRPFTKGID